MKFEDLEKKLNDTKEILKHISKSLITVEKNSFAIAKDIDNLKIIGEKMKEIIGTVTNIQEGVFTLKTPNGKIKTLKTGDVILKGEVVFGEAINTDLSEINISLNNEKEITLNGTQEQLFDSSLLASTFGNEEVAFTQDSVIQAMQNQDLTNIETASGQEENEEQDENSFKATFLNRDGTSTNIESDLRDTLVPVDEKKENDDITFFEEIQEQPKIEPTTLLGKITLDTPKDVIEGEDITVTATVDNAPETDLIITLNNGEIITIKAGDLSGTVTFKNVYADDIYKQGDRALDLSIKSTTGGNFESLDTTATAKVTIKDDEDITTVKIKQYSNVSISFQNEIAPVETLKTGTIPTISKAHNDSAPFLFLSNATEKYPSVKLTIPNGVEIEENGDFFYTVNVTIEKASDKDLVIINKIGNIETSTTIKAGELSSSFKVSINDYVDYKYKVNKYNFTDEDVYNNNKLDLYHQTYIKYSNDNDKLLIYNGNLYLNGDSKIDTTTVNFEADLINNSIVIKANLSNKIRELENRELYFNISIKDTTTGEVWESHIPINGATGILSLYDIPNHSFFKSGNLEITATSDIQISLYSIDENGIKNGIFAGNEFEDVSFGNFKVISTEEFIYKIETSNPPDQTKYDFIKTFPTIKVETTFTNSLNVESKEVHEVQLDKDGKGLLTITTDSIQKVSDIKVLEVNGNFEKTEIEVIKDDVTYKDITMPKKDIDLSNLPSIIEKNEINLKNGTTDKLLNISLEDVLKLSPEKSITIKGDEFDKVTFKDTIASDGTQNNWSKTAGTGEDSGYDIYLNTGDFGLQVKVEQPISDGITS